MISVQPTHPSVEVSLPRCHRCTSPEHLITGDGEPLVCRPCIDLLGGIAKSPSASDRRILDALIARHGDVVELVSVQYLSGESQGLHWEWTDRWPT